MCCAALGVLKGLVHDKTHKVVSQHVITSIGILKIFSFPSINQGSDLCARYGYIVNVGPVTIIAGGVAVVFGGPELMQTFLVFSTLAWTALQVGQKYFPDLLLL